MDLTTKSEILCTAIVGQFHSRTEIENNKFGLRSPAVMSYEIQDNVAWFRVSSKDETHSFHISLPFLKNNVTLLEQNEVHRAVCPYLMRSENRIMDYHAIIQRVIIDTPSCEGILSPNMIKKTSLIQQLVYSFDNENTSVVVYNIQRAINEIVNRMPLHETYLNSWVMNHRLMIIDPVFGSLRSPEDRLSYQVDKSKEFFPHGWTPIGLADGNLADKNYTLTTDIRKLTPFGMKYHNPQRNLYSTLKMKGDEDAKILSASMKELEDKSIKRTGWNWFTLFADIPDVFEDQIMVDESHKDKFITFIKRFQCYGMLKIKKGHMIRRGDTMSISDKGVVKKFNIDCDKAKIVKIAESTVNVGGVRTPVFNVIVSCRRYLRDGMKITNVHGNKGIIRMKELGYAVDPRGDGLRKIDVIVSARSIHKRKNYGQIIEALFNNLMPEENKPFVIPDDATVDMPAVKELLKTNGLPDDGTWHCETYVGPSEGVCGEVFWGVIASVENSLWDEETTIRKNTRDLRTAGLKLSHVEFRSLMTRFGKDNPILDEVMSYVQGSDDLHEFFKMLNSKRGVVPSDSPVVHVKDIMAVDQTAGTIVDEELIKDTVADDNFMPDGFVMQLPIIYAVYRDEKGAVIHEGAPIAMESFEDAKEGFVFDRIYVPKGTMRKCWKHDTGKLGMNEISALYNNIVVLSHRLMAEPNTPINITLMYRSVATFLSRLAHMMGTKRGEIARLGMAVRYPLSAKATATLSNRLPANTIEIHEDMAEQLFVKNGDVVLVERFPCLGFMSVRPQKVRVTKDEMARYTIRVSGNSLCSLGLDFDGDVIYLASFHTPEARELLRKEWENPNGACYDIICELNRKAGGPKVDNLAIDDYNISEFEALDADTHAAIVSNLTGVKSHTGPVIALAYNIMRILENSHVADDQDTNVAIEYFLDRVGNTVFKQKHGVKSLHAIVTDAICTGNVETLANEGFDRQTSSTIVEVIRQKAREVGVYNLADYHAKAKEKGWSNVINRIVKRQNHIYYASRADLEGCELLDHVEKEAVDVPSRILKTVLSGKAEQQKTKLEDCLDIRALRKLSTDEHKDACSTLMGLVDKMLCPQESICTDKAKENMINSFKAIRR